MSRSKALGSDDTVVEMSPEFDVIVYGTVCLDLIWRVDQLAAAGTYEPILEARRILGGEAANTAIALARWGMRVALVGTATGDDASGRELRVMFAAEAPNVDVSWLPVAPGSETPYCVCIATPDGHRTMYGSGFTDMQCPVLNPTLARSARLFTLEPNAYRSGLEACKIAAAASIDIVAMDYTASREVNRVAAISITSKAQLPSSFRLADAGDYASRIRDEDGCSAIVTCGENGCFVAEQADNGASAVHVHAYALEEVVDSTGAGDIFRAGIIYGHLQEWDLGKSARFASAAAALNCTAMGGWGGVRTVSEIEEFQCSRNEDSPKVGG